MSRAPNSRFMVRVWGSTGLGLGCGAEFVVWNLQFGVQGLGCWFWVWGLKFGVGSLPELLHHGARVLQRRVPLHLGRGVQVQG